MGGSSKSQTVGYKYHLGVHIALCHGPVDYLTRIKIGGKTAWSGRIDHGQITVDKPGLFGGESREGGVSGDLDFESGKPDQGVNDYLSARLGNLVPAFRGVACAVLRQMYIGMNPYLKKWEFRAQRIHTRQDGIDQWYDTKAEVSGIPKPWEHQSVPTMPGQITSWNRIAYSPDSRYLAICVQQSGHSLGYPLQIWDRHTNDFVDLSHIPSDEFPTEITEAVWSPDGKYLALNYNVGVAGYAYAIRIMDTSNWVLKDSFNGEYAGSYRMDWSPDGKWIAIVETGIKILNALTWTLSTTLSVSTPQLHDMRFSNDSQYLAFVSGSDVWILSTADWSIVVQISAPNALTGGSLDWSQTDQYLAVGMAGGTDGGWIVIESATWSIVHYEKITNTGVQSIKFSADDMYLMIASTTSSNEKTAVYYNHTWTELTDSYLPTSKKYGSIAFSPDGTQLAGLIYNTNDFDVFQIAEALPNNDINPAHIIRECLTDPDWGMGHPESDVDDDTFKAAADALYSEGMGMSLLWDRQQSIEEFIQLVLQHIDARLYVDPVTGLWTLKLVRFDYAVDDLPVLDESNIRRVESASRPAFGELINSVTVQFWDPISGGTDSVTVQDIALAQQQGAEINTTVQYPGFTNNQIAIRVAQRDLKALSTPLLSCTLYASRFAADLGIGEPFKMIWPDYGIGEMVMRVTDIAYGDDQDQTVRIKAVQDVFAIADAAITAPVETEWQEPDQTPKPVPAQAAVELPYYEIVQILGQTQADDLLGNNPDLGYIGVAAAQPENAINARFEVDAGGGYSDAGALDFCPTALLDQDIDPDQEVIAIRDGEALDEVTIGSHAAIGTELARVDAISDTQITLGRGVLDTVPVKHSDGDRVLFWDQFVESDGIERIINDQLDVKVLPVSGDGMLDPADATPASITMDKRAIRPYPPGQFKINGSYHPETIEESAALELTWAHRDRIQQTGSAIIDHTAADIGPESGTTYTVRIYGEGGTQIKEVTGITGTSYTYPTADEITDTGIGRLNSRLTVELWSVRDAHDSHQKHSITVLRGGWGSAWGYYWGV